MTSPGVAATFSRSAASTETSSRSRSSWLGRSPSTSVELGHRDGHEVGVRDPGAVEAVPRLAVLVLADAGEGDLVHLRRRDGSG